MESSTKAETERRSPGKPPEDRPPQPADALPDGAPDGLKAAANAGAHSKPDLAPGVQDPAEKAGAEEEAEAGALDFLLTDPHAIQYDVPVALDIPGGRTKELTFVVRQLDGDRILELEDEHTRGFGPLARLDDAPFNAALVAEGTITIQEKDKDGNVVKEVDPRSKEWMGNEPDPAHAMGKRFQFQAGLLSGVAGQIRYVSGWAGGRVGTASRPVRDAVRS